MPINRLTDFKRGVLFTKKRALLQYTNRFLYVNITILILEFLKKKIYYLVLKHMPGEIPQEEEEEEEEQEQEEEEEEEQQQQQ